ncbi:MAG TPA: hypothetical protein DEQ31_09275 [Exiguobacterium sp.]|nr:hypothetical protein [Exiguobacterium sp.]
MDGMSLFLYNGRWKREAYESERKGMEEEWYFVSLSHFLDLRKPVGESIMKEEQFYTQERRGK